MVGVSTFSKKGSVPFFASRPGFAVKPACVIVLEL